MSGPSKELLNVLQPHVGPIRHVLHGMDPNDLPPGLRKVAAYAGGRLPPPLLKRLIIELDQNDWLRGKVEEGAGEQLDEIAAAFVARPEGWWMTLATAVGEASATQPAADLKPEVERLETKLAEAKRRTAELRAEHGEVKQALKRANRQLRSQDEQLGALHAVEALRREMTELESQLDAERSERLDAERRLDEVKRRKRKRTSDSTGNGEPRAAGMRDPVATARHLDLQAAALAAAVRGEPDAVDAALQVEDGSVWDLALPAGIAPDSPDAIDWLLRDAAPVPVIIDGYNVTYLMNPDRFTTPDSRKQLIADLERLLRHACPSHRVVVVFDSSAEGESQPSITLGGVEVYFATTADSADDEIVERARSLEGRAVVVTNDRELRERVEEEGALALWGTAFVEWAAS